MGNCGSKRDPKKQPTIKSPKGPNNELNNKGIFKPLKKEKESSEKPYRMTPSPFFGETGEKKLLF
jgi:hypothetical protein